MSVKIFPQRKYRKNKVFFVRNNGAIVTLQDSNGSFAWDDTVTYGENWPDWRERLAKGLDTTTTLTVAGKKSFIRTGAMRCSLKVPRSTPTALSWYLQSGDFNLKTTFSTVNPSGISSSKAQAEALGKFVTRATRVNTLFQGGVFLGELRQAIHGIKNPAQGLRRLVDATARRMRRLRHNARKQKVPPANVALNLADLWLEQAFHWNPLMHDIQDAAYAANELLRNQAARPESRPVRGQKTVVSNVVVSPPAIHVDGIGAWKVHETFKETSVVIYRGAIRVEALSDFSGTAKLLGLDAQSFLPTVWELLPYSFLIDYFTNVGEIVYGLSLPRSLVAWSNVTIIRESEVDRWVTSHQGDYAALTSKLDSFKAPRSRLTWKHVLRESYTGSFIPALTLDTPGRGSRKWLNIAALAVAQSLDRRFRWL